MFWPVHINYSTMRYNSKHRIAPVPDARDRCSRGKIDLWMWQFFELGLDSV